MNNGSQQGENKTWPICKLKKKNKPKIAKRRHSFFFLIPLALGDELANVMQFQFMMIMMMMMHTVQKTMCYFTFIISILCFILIIRWHARNRIVQYAHTIYVYLLLRIHNSIGWIHTTQNDETKMPLHGKWFRWLFKSLTMLYVCVSVFFFR